MIGSKLLHFQITAHLGSGGMGDVYQADDTKLGRSVAIKLLPEAFSHDSERVARFEREARVLASLNHENIAAIYGLEESGGRRFLVMELVEGETLAQRIKRGPIPVGEALGIATKITEALEAAHEKGVVHRDLKPANVKITPEGKVKVLDFGLAKAYETEASKVNLSQSPTLSMAATNAGVILGTAAYMSPEQAKGGTVDRRTDIFAFGSVLYEMLTGRAAFDGDDVPDILGAVLRSEPDWSRLRSDVPPSIRKLLRLCLQKDAKKRRQTATDVRIDIEQALTEPVAAMPAHAPTRSARPAWIASLAVAAVLIVALGIPALRYLRETPPPEMRVDIVTPPSLDLTSLAISPDGQKIVFVADSGGPKLWLRSLDSAAARALAGTNGAQFPFWSPDNRSIGFFADRKLKRIDLDGGLVTTLANASAGRGGTWNRDGVILFVPTPGGATGAIFRIPATGGEPAVVKQLEAQQDSHFSPQFLPDGRHFLYYVRGTPEARGVYIGQLEGSPTQRLLDADAAAVYAASGHLLFVRQGTLFAQGFDTGHLLLAGSPFALAEQLLVNPNVPAAALSASAAGPIVYRTGSLSGSRRQFVWLDRSGNEIEKVGNPDNANGGDPSLSPDGRRVALERFVTGNSDIWLLELRRAVLSRFTFDAAIELGPVWSPDGSRIVFNSNRKGERNLYQRPATGAGNDELLLATSQNKMAMDWSPDGRFLLYRSNDPKTNYDIWALPMDGDRKPFPVVQTNFVEGDAQFSPDGKWIAYYSNESGRFEIYVQPFPGSGGKRQISIDGGAQPRWGRDGKELFYIGLDDRLMSVPIRFGPGGQAVEVGAPVPLFTTNVGGAVQGVGRQQYAVSADGQRFLMNTISLEATSSSITLLQNWNPPAK